LRARCQRSRISSKPRPAKSKLADDLLTHRGLLKLRLDLIGGIDQAGKCFWGATDGRPSYRGAPHCTNDPRDADRPPAPHRLLGRAASRSTLAELAAGPTAQNHADGDARRKGDCTRAQGSRGRQDNRCSNRGAHARPQRMAALPAPPLSLFTEPMSVVGCCCASPNHVVVSAMISRRPQSLDLACRKWCADGRRPKPQLHPAPAYRKCRPPRTRAAQ